MPNLYQQITYFSNLLTLQFYNQGSNKISPKNRNRIEGLWWSFQLKMPPRSPDRKEFMIYLIICIFIEHLKQVINLRNFTMRNLCICFCLILLTSCRVNSHQDPPVQSGASNFRTENIEIDTLRDPIHFSYLSDLPLRQVAKLILNDSVTPTDNDITFKCMDSMLNKNAETRDYFFPVFMKILEQADGALAEVVGSYVIQYVEHYSYEFFSRCEHLNTNQFETLASAAGNELYFEDDNVNYTKKWGDLVISNCVDCSTKQIELIQKFNSLVLNNVIINNKQ